MNSGHFEHFFFYILPLYWLLEMLLELSPKKELLILKCLSMTYLFFVESLLKYNCTLKIKFKKKSEISKKLYIKIKN